MSYRCPTLALRSESVSDEGEHLQGQSVGLIYTRLIWTRAFYKKKDNFNLNNKRIALFVQLQVLGGSIK